MEQCIEHRKGKVYYVLGHKEFLPLCAPLERYEYMRMQLTDFPDHIVQQYDLARKAKNGSVYIKIRRSIYGLPQSGRLAMISSARNSGPKDTMKSVIPPACGSI